VSVAAGPVFADAPAGFRRELAIGLAVVAVVVATFLLAPVSGTSLAAVRLESAARVLVVGIPVAVGLYAWRGVPFGRLGILLVLSGVVWLVVTFSLADRAVAYSIGRVASWIGWTALVYLMLAFPDGRLLGRIDRALAATLVAVVAVLWLPTALLVDRYPTPSEWVTCSGNCPHNAFMLVDHEPGIVANVVVPLRELLLVLLFLAVVARLVQRIALASRIRRRTLTPVLVVAMTGIAVVALGLVVRRFAPGSDSVSVARWLAALALPAMAIAFLVGLVRWRLYVGASLSRFAASLGAPLGPEAVRVAFANAFDDPRLAIVYPIADGRWAAADGRPAASPTGGVGRSVTELRGSRGEVVAVLVHDDALQAEKAFINAVGSYATLTLENNRLAAEVTSLLRDMRETQARAAASADRAREQIERDLHDGAQQRLVALRIQLELAAERPGADEASAVRLHQLGGEVELAIDELRSLARGVYTPALADRGPVAAIREAARHASIDTTVTGQNLRRHSPQVERAVYFCCLEALQNVYKHARPATSAHIIIAELAHELIFEVNDDGVGFDLGAAKAGAGLHNMRDRLAPLDGRLTIETAPGHGTRIIGVIPLNSNRPTPDRSKRSGVESPGNP
jgi:signal transduction histidine kinase